MVVSFNSPSTDGDGCVYQPGFPEYQVVDKELSNFSLPAHLPVCDLPMLQTCSFALFPLG